MSTQQDIYAAGSENRPPMLNKENCVPWSSPLLRYAKRRPNGKLIYNSIINGPYVRPMIPELGDANRAIPVFCIWKPLGRNTLDLSSFGEETDKTMDLHQHCSRISPQKLEMASQITRDAVTTISKAASQDLKTASDYLSGVASCDEYACLRSLEKQLFVCIAVDMSRKT
ncbi:hypothetical protein Tco_0502899 [Tanacetum coccineum]